MGLKYGDLAPNPELQGPAGPDMLYHASDRGLHRVLWLGPDGPPPERWEDLKALADATPDFLRVLRVLPEGHPAEHHERLDASHEAHRRYDAYDWVAMKPTRMVVMVDAYHFIRHVSEGETLETSALFDFLERRAEAMVTSDT